MLGFIGHSSARFIFIDIFQYQIFIADTHTRHPISLNLFKCSNLVFLPYSSYSRNSFKIFKFAHISIRKSKFYSHFYSYLIGCIQDVKPQCRLDHNRPTAWSSRFRNLLTHFKHYRIWSLPPSPSKPSIGRDLKPKLPIPDSQAETPNSGVLTHVADLPHSLPALGPSPHRLPQPAPRVLPTAGYTSLEPKKNLDTDEPLS